MSNIMEIKYTEKSLSDLLNYVVGLYSGLIKQDLALIVVTSDNQEYRDNIVNRDYDLKPFKFDPIPNDSQIPTKNICKKQLSDGNKLLYKSFLTFVVEFCVFKDDESLKIKGSDLLKEFSIYMNKSIDARNVFPSIMAEFMKNNPFIIRRPTPKGIVYIGINLKINISDEPAPNDIPVPTSIPVNSNAPPIAPNHLRIGVPIKKKQNSIPSVLKTQSGPETNYDIFLGKVD